ncbi:chromogranin-A isoform X2 [Cuculus canorus]|uniref:chromogranin-A isoform X2 n=1 Tax=Cuculus canorus TaxID=55661 RepID=UPI0023AB4B98|nr:chromogranin-A isoform X2 [Cuculus canorus]
MSCPGLLAVLLLAVPAISLPVTNDMNKGDTKVMKCIVEVISDTLSKPNPLPISEECLETLRGDERIISILRHQNLLKELQEIAAQGANERTQQQKKNSGFEDELSEVLESQNDKNKQRDAAEERPEEERPAGSVAELAAQKTLQNEDSDDDDALGFSKDGQSSEEEEEEQPRALRGGRHRLEDEEMQGEEDTFQPRDARSEEMEEESSREWEASKKWNKMDKLAKQLTSKKRMEENESEEDPDRSMKIAFRSHKYDFSHPEEDVRRSWKHHSKDDSSEGVFPLVPMPEEKKDEEGSANRRTEDQELESLAAIEAELERVAHKLHELRRG